jgi:hypothetical protein
LRIEATIRAAENDALERAAASIEACGDFGDADKADHIRSMKHP